MGIFYSTNAEPFQGAMDFSKIDATKAYLKHYENSLTLKFIANASKDGREKRQAADELLIAERKMKFWERQERFDKAMMIQGVERLKKHWETKA